MRPRCVPLSIGLNASVIREFLKKLWLGYAARLLVGWAAKHDEAVDTFDCRAWR